MMPELNPSDDRHPPGLFTGILNLLLTLRKKAYLIDLSFEFNEIKFCNLLMNWLIWGKIFTYFYNKFRPVNYMCYMKCEFIT